MTEQAQRILLADDNRVFAKTLCFNLEAAGYDTTVAGDGEEALRMAQQDQFDLVIADYQMPKMVGLQLCRRLREDERYAQTPMILISGFEDLKIVELFDDLDLLEAVLVKPFNTNELLSQIQKCLGRFTHRLGLTRQEQR